MAAAKPRKQPVPLPTAKEAPASLQTEPPMLLRLFVTGSTRKSARAITNLKRICDEHAAGAYHLEIVDLYQEPGAAAGEQILAAPTLIKKLPPPVRRLIGDLSDEQRVLTGLDLAPRFPYPYPQPQPQAQSGAGASSGAVDAPSASAPAPLPDAAGNGEPPAEERQA